MAKPSSTVSGGYVQLEGELYYRIGNSELMPEFMMSVVGASDHWMFVSSNGALTAGRRNPDLALFPYAADDQICAAASTTGSITMIRVNDTRGTLWEPFATLPDADFAISRNLYKSPLGNKLVFEEVNSTLSLTFRYRWTFSEKYGFVRDATLVNESADSCDLVLLDGIRNVLPFGVVSEFQMRFSNLGNAYKKSELLSESGLALLYLSSIPTDKAEPSEGLRATTVWSSGLKGSTVAISSQQLDAFRQGQRLRPELDVRGKSGAYLLEQQLTLSAGESTSWKIVAELAQDHVAVVGLSQWLQSASTREIENAVQGDILANEKEFAQIVASADGMQVGTNELRCKRHLSNTVFNLMRGGVPLQNYEIPVEDFRDHVRQFNRKTYQRNREFLETLPTPMGVEQLQSLVAEIEDPALARLALEYLPFAFSRRHGDPTRPWNRFSIDLRREDGSTDLNYQGNWRDIFQNWEAIGVSFPRFFPSMICRFLNATTADGYNPYKVTKDGFHWEEPSPDDPWANIGYWGDHQIIYLLKLLEWAGRFQPEALDGLIGKELFAHANVPYRIRPFSEIRENSSDTILYDWELSEKISERVKATGSDGKLLHDRSGEVARVTLVEKLLTLSLAKLSNFVPGGGIWLNTQRPEWNDANNALVGNGLSMVTTCYLHRWFLFLEQWFGALKDDSFRVSTEVTAFFVRIKSVLEQSLGQLNDPADAKQRESIVNGLSKAGCEFRDGLYSQSWSGEKDNVSREDLLAFFAASRKHIAATIRSNRRDDGLYHAYNLLDWNESGVEIDHLYEMTEGQVAVLSAKLLTAAESIEVLDAMRESRLYRADQASYLLYPDRQLPRFLDKNSIDPNKVTSNPLLSSLVESGDGRIVAQNVNGGFHFNGDFRNAADVSAAIDKLGSPYKSLVREHGPDVAALFEETFDHRRFTGRSGTFFGYEGLGSIYWHMVSKLGLAVAENFFHAVDAGESVETIASLRRHFGLIRAGIGAEKSPEDYGAFPIDPYSHTPEKAGVKQPGMTGQVKEDVLSRFAELGVEIVDSCLGFRFELFDQSELSDSARQLSFFSVTGEEKSIAVPAGGFGFTLFQVPVVFSTANQNQIRIAFEDGQEKVIQGHLLDADTSSELFSRTGRVGSVHCDVIFD